MKSKKIQAILLFLVVSAFTTASLAEVPMPMPTTDTSTLYGGSALAPGSFTLGATTGFPETSFDVYFGLGPIFDLGIQTGFTYGTRLGGNRQRLGLDLHVPLRWTLLRTTALAGGLRVAPYFMIGEAKPAISFGADVAFLLDIPMPKIFTLIVGP